MILKLKSKKPVSTNILDLAEKNTVYCKLLNFFQQGDGFSINASYFYLKETGVSLQDDSESTYTEAGIQSFGKSMTNDQADALYLALGIVYPTGATYTERRVIDLTAALLYMVGDDKPFGLVGSDWEIDPT
jgi:hypothetical protein